MRRTAPQFLAALLVAAPLVAAACDDGTVTEPGIVDYHGESADVVRVPAFARVGETIAVTVATYGDGCTRADDMDEVHHEEAIDFMPRDRRYTEGQCLSILRRPQHPAEISFEVPGEKIVRVHGRRVGQDFDEPTVVVHTLMVQ